MSLNLFYLANFLSIEVFFVNINKINDLYFSKRPTVEECLEHRWFTTSDFMIKKRERAIFRSDKIRVIFISILQLILI